MKMRVGILTSGGDCPGLNATIRGVATAAVPWAKPGSRFTTDFAFAAAWMVKWYILFIEN